MQKPNIPSVLLERDFNTAAAVSYKDRVYCFALTYGELEIINKLKELKWFPRAFHLMGKKERKLFLSHVGKIIALLAGL